MPRRIGILGAGEIVRIAHLPGYRKHGIEVAGVYDLRPEVAAETGERVYESVDALLEDPSVEVVDIATHPAVRYDLVLAALRAGKHVLSQKPFAVDVAHAQTLIEEADRRGLTVAVNQNARWAPAFRKATDAIRAGKVGDVLAVTHFFDLSHRWIVGTPFDQIRHWTLYDYSVHWFDITRCWTERETPVEVRAVENRLPSQPPESRQPWGFDARVLYASGATAHLRTAGDAKAFRGHLFWVHGTEGTIRGSVAGDDFVEIDGERVPLEGSWFPDGFGGAAHALFDALEGGYEPEHSARHNLLSLSMTLAACESAAQDGKPIRL